MKNFPKKPNPEPVVEDEWLTTDEAARFLKTPKKSLQNMVSNGKVPFYKFCGRNRYSKRELQQMILATRREGYGNG